ncbi:MAG: DNA primase [Actinomycetales bacterium]|nr:DNA primase [Actinomycetales bacterium]
MPGLITRNDIDELRSRVDIGQIVGDYVTLKRAGVDSLTGLCPFHDERSPSFHVRPRVGRYHCFGCGEDGDVFTFLMKMDSLGFQEAVERLAQRVGFELHYEDGGGPSDHSKRARLLSANTAAEAFFRAQLATPEAQPARDFLGSRGFDAAAAERFGVGFAPKSFQALADALKAQGFTEEELLAAGLLSRNDRGNVYDRFRGRAVWPIRDTTGQTVGFGARKLLDDDNGPKYLNTPETPVYHKAQVLYGLDLARRDIAKGKQVVVVEGYTDVMACHLAGVTTAVATCGTSFGADHITVLRRVLGDQDNANVAMAGQVVFTFDPDEAGQTAASRAFAEEQRFAAQTFVATGPEGLDPCDLRLAQGDAAVRAMIESRKPMFEFMVRRQLAGHDLETVEGRVAALRAAAPVVAGIRDRSLSDRYVRELAGWLGENPVDVEREVRAAGQRRPARGSGPANPARSGPGRSGTVRPDPSRPGRLDGADGAPRSDGLGAGELAAETPRGAQLTDLPADPMTRGERDALMALLQHPEAVDAELAARLVRVRFANATLAVVRDAVAAALEHRESAAFVERVAEQAPPGFEGLVSQLAVAPLPADAAGVAAYCRGVVAGLVDRDLLREKAEVLGALQRAAADGDGERQRELARRAAELETERRRLRDA